jgi:hypothetical protein
MAVREAIPRSIGVSRAAQQRVRVHFKAGKKRRLEGLYRARSHAAASRGVESILARLSAAAMLSALIAASTRTSLGRAGPAAGKRKSDLPPPFSEPVR